MDDTVSRTASWLRYLGWFQAKAAITNDAKEASLTSLAHRAGFPYLIIIKSLWIGSRNALEENIHRVLQGIRKCFHFFLFHAGHCNSWWKLFFFILSALPLILLGLLRLLGVLGWTEVKCSTAGFPDLLLRFNIWLYNFSWSSLNPAMLLLYSSGSSKSSKNLTIISPVISSSQGSRFHKCLRTSALYSSVTCIEFPSAKLCRSSLAFNVEAIGSRNLSFWLALPSPSFGMGLFPSDVELWGLSILFRSIFFVVK